MGMHRQMNIDKYGSIDMDIDGFEQIWMDRYV